jgi:hypothetical protein
MEIPPLEYSGKPTPKRIRRFWASAIGLWFMPEPREIRTTRRRGLIGQRQFRALINPTRKRGTEVTAQKLVGIDLYSNDRFRALCCE